MMVTLPDGINAPALEIKSLKIDLIEVQLPEGLGYKVRVPPVAFTDPEKDAYLRGLPMLLILCPSVLGFPILFFLGRSRQPITFTYGSPPLSHQWRASSFTFPTPHNPSNTAYLAHLQGRPLMDRFTTDFLIENPGLLQVAEV